MFQMLLHQALHLLLCSSELGLQLLRVCIALLERLLHLLVVLVLLTELGDERGDPLLRPLRDLFVLFVLLIGRGSLASGRVALGVGSPLVLRECIGLRSRRALLFPLLACVAPRRGNLLGGDWLALLVHGDLDGWEFHLSSGQG